jgi:magnesium transporter
MFSEVRKRVEKAGMAPGTAVYTGSQNNHPPVVTISTYDTDTCDSKTGDVTMALPDSQHTAKNTWIHIQGLSDVNYIKNLADHYAIHPLTVEDILNVAQRPKIEEFDHYLFITLKVLRWQKEKAQSAVDQVSIVLGKNFIISFTEFSTPLFDPILLKLKTNGVQRLRQQPVDYLGYRLIDAVVDGYFVVLEGLGEEIELVEQRIIASPTRQNARTIYKLKHEAMTMRKAIWPMREALSHLLYAEEELISKFTRVYLRDVYDHTMQAIDTIETFRDMLSSMVDMYLSGLTIRMNEIMKTLTIITTIFIPITALASIYGMNLIDIPFMKSHMGFYIVSSLMCISVAIMITYFRKKKWI